MPLVRARCRACSLPLGDPPHTALAVACGRCGLGNQVQLAADGQPAGFEPSFGPAQLLEWLVYARSAMASGALGVALGACSACRAPLAISSSQVVSLACPHCGEATSGPSARVLVDQWTEPWAHVSGGNVDVEYRLVMLEDTRGESAGCAACGMPAPPTDPSNRCASCGAVGWLSPRTEGGGRIQLGVRVDGTRNRLPFKAIVPIVTGEGMLRADAAHGTSARSGSSLVNITAVGCASALALAVLAAVAIAIAIHFAHC
jgi:hypothetical protein